MSLPVIVDIAIGLVFIYLLLSLLASEIQELITTILQWRAKHLKDSIINLFASDVNSNHSIEKANKLTKQVYQHPLIRGINQESKGFLPNLFRGFTWLISLLYRRIVGKSEGEFGDRRTAPSYIPREAFATALLEQLGTKYFVERLVEAKFSDFIELILEKVTANEAVKNLSDYKVLEGSLRDIEDDFIRDSIDLESAVNSIKLKLDKFLSGEEIKGIPDALAELSDWNTRVLVEDTERIIKNAGLEPTLQEIVDSIDKDSKTYRTYKKRFARYEQERFEEVRDDLRHFEKFLLEFLKSLLNKEAFEKLELLGNPFDPNPSNQTKLAGLVFEKSSLKSSGGQPSIPIKRNKTPMSQIEQVTIKNLIQLENVGTTKDSKRQNIRAFREGFSGQNYLSNRKDLGLFQEVIYSKIIPFLLLFFLGFLITVALSDLPLEWWGKQGAVVRNLLVGPWGGWVSIICLTGIPLAWFTVSRYCFAQSHTAKNEGANKTLAEIFDDYSVDEIPLELKDTTAVTPVSTESTSNDDPEKEGFSQDISRRLQYLDGTADAFRYNEVKDLGRSFRRYYLRLLLENADIDLPFIPNSIKQSLAVLIRRSKVSARKAEDQVLQLKAEVEDWYDRSMERASGVYRRNAKGISILIGIGLAIAVNANSIHILDQLAFDDELRQTIVTTAQQSVENGDASDREALLNELEQSLDEINLPIGWDPYLINEEFNCNLPKQKADAAATNEGTHLWYELIQSCIYDKGSVTSETGDSLEPPETFFFPTAIASIFLQQPLVALRSLLGWIITGIAISMGASFWFDLLSKLVKVRNTGQPDTGRPLATSDTSERRPSATTTPEKEDK